MSHLLPNHIFLKLANGKEPVFPCVTICYYVLPCVTLCSPVLPCLTLCYSVLRCVTLCSPVLPCVSPLSTKLLFGQDSWVLALWALTSSPSVHCARKELHQYTTARTQAIVRQPSSLKTVHVVKPFLLAQMTALGLRGYRTTNLWHLILMVLKAF